MKNLVFLFAVCMLGFSPLAKADFPENDLHLEDDINSKDANIDEPEFNRIIESVYKHFEPIVKLHGAELKRVNDWESSTVNAYARQTGNVWQVAMYGGLARRSEVTKDGFALVVCHELGHHLAGYPFYSGSLGAWAGAEGQSDYFASQVCARKIWATDYNENAKYRASAPEVVKNKCNASWKTVEAQDLCYRIADAGRSLAHLLASLRRNPAPQFDTPDRNQVQRTVTSHPAAQCRLDTYFAGALCNVRQDVSLIPGKEVQAGNNSLDAQKLAFFHSCNAAVGAKMARPGCWFKAQEPAQP